MGEAPLSPTHPTQLPPPTPTLQNAEDPITLSPDQVNYTHAVKGGQPFFISCSFQHEEIRKRYYAWQDSISIEEGLNCNVNTVKERFMLSLATSSYTTSFSSFPLGTRYSSCTYLANKESTTGTVCISKPTKCTNMGGVPD